MHAGLPRDPAQWIALALAAAAIAVALAARRLAPAHPFSPPARRALVAAAAIAAALLSAAYVAAYLRGGPRIIDATSYWLEARALAGGRLAWPLGEPAASTMGRFLVRPEAPGDPQVAVIFPPGYPAALALGFLAGAPLAVGPVLAAALALATYDLAARAARLAAPTAPAPAAPLTAAIALAFSVTCAALRYHTADTMSHGLAALCFTAALTLTLRALERCAEAPEAPRASPLLASPLPAALLAGAALGWLTAARPASGCALAATLLALLAHRPDPPAIPVPARLRVAAAIALGALPGLALLALHQRAATGAWASSQALYYATSDGPPGCFRYGFGAGVGCLGEHGDFVRHNLPRGFGFIAAAGTTLRRLKLHLLDPLNAEPLFPLVLAGAAIAWRRRGARILVLPLLLQIAAYAPFYFDGNYPGGGARFYADVLPVEHALAALAAAALAARASTTGPRAAPSPGAQARATPHRALRWIALAAAFPLLGFALRAGFDHAHLRDREGGAPMFDPALLARAGVERGLVFVDTDHGWNLAHVPAPDAPVQVLRLRGDALDRMAWEARGRPPAFHYHLEIPPDGPAITSIAPLAFDPAPARDGPLLLTIEGESLWPARAQRDAWAAYEHASAPCASSGRWLAVHDLPLGDPGAPAARAGPGLVVVDLPAPWLRGALASPRVALAGGASGAVRLLADGAEVHAWPLPPAPPGVPACLSLDPAPVPPGAARVELALALDPGPAGAGRLFALDALSISGGKAVDR